MEYISSKNICLLIRDTCKLFDRRPMDHGSRTGYIMYKMLLQKGGYELFELADFLMIATLHDIGVYHSGHLGDRQEYEFKNPVPHSVFGYLFLKNFSPLGDLSKMLLYHRIPSAKMENVEFEYKEETEILKLAEAVDIYYSAAKDRFKPGMFRIQQGTVYSRQALDLFDLSLKEENYLEKLDDDSYQTELDELLDYIMLPNEHKTAYMEMLMYCLGFRSEKCIVDSLRSLAITEELGKRLKLRPEEQERLYYGTLLHDIGMLSIPISVIDAPRSLTKEEISLMRTHVIREEKILLNRMDPEIVKICTCHHERLDGSGYPFGIKEFEMTLPQMILQVADIVTGLTAERNHKPPKSKDAVIEILRQEAMNHRLNTNVVSAMIENYDIIENVVKTRIATNLEIRKDMMAKYEAYTKAFGGNGGKQDA